MVRWYLLENSLPTNCYQRLFFLLAFFFDLPNTMHIGWRPHLFYEQRKAPRLTVKSCIILSENLCSNPHCWVCPNLFGTKNEILAKQSELLWRKSDGIFLELLRHLHWLYSFFCSKQLRDATLKKKHTHTKQAIVRSKHYAFPWIHRWCLLSLMCYPFWVC